MEGITIFCLLLLRVEQRSRQRNGIFTNEQWLSWRPAIRQGQFLPREFAIRSPGAVLNTLRDNLKLKSATTEAAEQYKNLVYLRIATLIDVGHGFKRLEIIDTQENREALDIAYDLVNAGTASGIEVDEDARRALQAGYSYTESLISSGDLKKNVKVKLSQGQNREIEEYFLKL